MTMAETEYSRAKTSVWWDIENCEVPRACDAHAIAQNVSSALLNMNYCGPVSISAYGDTILIPPAVQQALSSTGVGLNHVPAGVKDASDKKILVDMLLWAVDNPAPANFMLISGDRDFSNALHQLSMRRYTILLAQPPRASAPLVAAAKNVWLWTSLALGGPPLTNGESSRLINNGRCLVSNYEASKDPVSEQAQSSKPTDSTSDAGDTKDQDHTIREKHVPTGNMLRNGRRAAGESVASCDSFEAHFSDKRHTSQAAFVASHKDQTNVSAKPIQETAYVERVLCSKDAYAKHTYGKRHRNNLELQSGKSANMSRGPVGFCKEVMEKQKNKKKATEYRTKSNAYYTCRLCNVVCQSQVDFDSHLRGQKHTSIVSQSEALIGSKKLQEKGLGEKDQPREAIAEPQLQSLNGQEDTKCFEKHVAMVNQSEAHIDSTKLEEKGVQEKVQPIETMSEPRPQSQDTKENTRFFEKQNEEFREICGTLESSVQENFLNTKDPNGEFFSGDINCDFEIPREARECFDSTVKPVHQFDEATEHSGEVKREQKVVMVHRSSKLCHLCVVVCDIQGLSRVVCDSKFHWTKKKHTTAAFVTSDDAQSCVSRKPKKEPEALQHVWCQVCQISCNSKVAYANHTYGKKHRQNLELQSAKNENMSKGPGKLSEENAERMKKVPSKNQTAFGCSQNHTAMAKEQREKAFVDPRSTRQAFDQRALEHALIVDSRKIRDESDIEKETTEEHTLIKIDDLGFQGGQEDKEEVKEINDISESLVQPNRESRIPKESRGCLDVIPERVQLPADVNVTEMEDESKHKPEPRSRDYTGLKEHPGEAAKREETKVQVDNF